MRTLYVVGHNYPSIESRKLSTRPHISHGNKKARLNRAFLLISGGIFFLQSSTLRNQGL
jgi:hypothetical protein